MRRASNEIFECVDLSGKNNRGPEA